MALAEDGVPRGQAGLHRSGAIHLRSGRSQPPGRPAPRCSQNGPESVSTRPGGEKRRKPLIGPGTGTRKKRYGGGKNLLGQFWRAARAGFGDLSFPASSVEQCGDWVGKFWRAARAGFGDTSFPASSVKPTVGSGIVGGCVYWCSKLSRATLRERGRTSLPELWARLGRDSAINPSANVPACRPPSGPGQPPRGLQPLTHFEVETWPWKVPREPLRSLCNEDGPSSLGPMLAMLNDPANSHSSDRESRAAREALLILLRTSDRIFIRTMTTAPKDGGKRDFLKIKSSVTLYSEENYVKIRNIKSMEIQILVKPIKINQSLLNWLDPGYIVSVVKISHKGTKRTKLLFNPSW
nr:uncharacterized protein LOC129051836 [Pongo abelii]